MANKWGLWTGTEVEGRHKGLKTLIVRTAESARVFRAVEDDASIQHIWFCKEAVVTAVYQGVVQTLAATHPVTLEVDFSTLVELTGIDLPASVELIYEVDTLSPLSFEQFCIVRHMLKPDDSVRFTFGLFMTVGAKMADTWGTAPGDYMNDVLLESSREGQDRSVYDN